MKSFLRKIRHKTIVKNLVVSENNFILDASCQDGTFLSMLVKNNPGKNLKIHGIDTSKEEIAKTTILNGIFKVGDDTAIPFGKGMFDVVVSSLTLHHMPKPADAILEMKRVLKKEGSIYIVDIMAEQRWFNFIIKKLTCPEPYHFEKFYSLSEVLQLCSDSGLILHSKKKAIIFPTFSLISPVLILEFKKKKDY